MRLLSLLQLTALAALALLAVPTPAHAQAGGIVASAASFVLPFVLHLLLPVLGGVVAIAITWILAKEAAGFGWIKAHTKSKEQADAVDALDHLTETATQAVLAKVGQDVLAQKSAADIAADALAALKQSVSLDHLGALAKQVAGIGKDELAWYLTHLLTAKAAPVLSAAQGKTLLVPIGSTAGMSPAEKRNLVANAGVAAL